jgi:hypothetical protein
MLPPKYKPLQQEFSNDEDIYPHHQEAKRQNVSKIASIILIVSLICSICLNIVLLCQNIDTRIKDPWLPASKYGRDTLQNRRTALMRELVGLTRNVPFWFSHDKVYTSSNRSVADAAWNAPRLQSWNGLVALSKEYVVSHGLPEAQKWPWDHAKGLYILNGFHNLHCLVSIVNSRSISSFLLIYVPTGSYPPKHPSRLRQ